MGEHRASIRPATAQEVTTILGFLRQMLSDMTAVGGYPVTAASEHWTNVESELLDQLRAPGYLHLLAERGSARPEAIGWAFARSEEREPVYKPARVLHIRADHVIEEMVRKLGANVRSVERAFNPEGGAYGHGAVSGHSHGHGHDHGHSHGGGHHHHH